MATLHDPILEVDAEKLAATQRRYAQEATKRLKAERQPAFEHLSNAEKRRLQSSLEDPWVDHEALNAQDPPLKQDQIIKVFIIGAGFGGILAAVRFIQAGVATAEEIRLVDSAGGFGGTWYWHRYPGLHCDVESYMYLPLLEETGYIPKHKYSSGAEVREHAERIAKQWGFADNALFRSDVNSAEWNEDTQLWNIKLTKRRGPSAHPIDLRVQAQYVYLASGNLTRPVVPNIPGILSFSGSLFHTSRWNYAVSGGSQADQILTRLKDKKVAVIGTAATGIGVIPEVARYAKELYVIQRTPAYVKRRDQRVTDVAEFTVNVANKKGWQFERQLNWNSFLTHSNRPGQENLVGDAWTDMPAYSAVLGNPSRGIIDPSSEGLARHAAYFHALDLPHMEAVRARVDEIVLDPDTAAKLKPWYPSWCKRPTFSDTYLQTFNEPHVHLLDTDGQGPSAATKDGIVVGGKEYPIDVIILGTGYETTGPRSGSPAAKTGIEILGRNKRSLDEKWKSNGAATLHGYATNEFPNLFFASANQATITGNNTMMLSFISQHVAYMISRAQMRVGSGQRPIIEVTQEAEEAHTVEILRRAPFYSNLAPCTPGYFNGHGEAAKVTDPEAKTKRARNASWSEGMRSFLSYIYDWEDEGSLQGLSIIPAANNRGFSKL